MMLSSKLSHSLIVTFLASLLLCGCGGDAGTKTAGPTFHKQYEEAMALTNAEARARKLLGLALEQNKSQDLSGAKKSLADAAKACSEVELPAQARCSVYSELANVQAALGNKAEALQALKVAQTATEKIESAESRAEELCNIAAVQGGKLGDKNAASDTLDAAEKLLEQLQDAKGRALIRAKIVKASTTAQLAKQAERVLDAGVKEAEGEADPATKADALTTLALAEFGLGKKTEALAMLKTANEAAEGIEQPYTRVYSMAKVASADVRCGATAEALAILKKAEGMVAQIHEPDLQKEALAHVRKQLDKLK